MADKSPSGDFWCADSIPKTEAKHVHCHHQKKIFFKALLASATDFPGEWSIQKACENPGKQHLPRKPFLCGPYVFRQRKVPQWRRVLCGFFFPGGKHTIKSAPDFGFLEVSKSWSMAKGTIPQGGLNPFTVLDLFMVGANHRGATVTVGFLYGAGAETLIW